MQVVLVMFRSDGERRSFSVVRDITVLGRREDCDLRIPLSDISRKHCRVIRSGQSVRIEDLGSSNGTLCNGERITSVELQAGDVLGVGPVTFVVQIDGVPSDEEMNPATDSARAASFAPHDTATAAAVVGVGMLHEVGPAVADSMADQPLLDADELEEVEDLGAAPLVSQGAEDDITELEPIADLEPIEGLEPDPLEAVTTPAVGARPVPATSYDEPEAVDELADITDFDDEPVAPSAAASTAPPLPPGVLRSPAPPVAATKKVPRVAPPPPPLPVTEPEQPEELTPLEGEPAAEVVEGELASSDEFVAVNEEASEFDIVIDDDSANSSASGELNIDWSEESKSGR